MLKEVSPFKEYRWHILSTKQLGKYANIMGGMNPSASYLTSSNDVS